MLANATLIILQLYLCSQLLHYYILKSSFCFNLIIFSWLLTRGRGRGREKKSPKKPAKKSSSRKKAPPNPTPPHLPFDDEFDRSPSQTPVRSSSASQTSCPSAPVISIAGDGKGPGEDKDAAKKKRDKKPKKPRTPPRLAHDSNSTLFIYPGSLASQLTLAQLYMHVLRTVC